MFFSFFRFLSECLGLHLQPNGAKHFSLSIGNVINTFTTHVCYTYFIVTHQCLKNTAFNLCRVRLHKTSTDFTNPLNVQVNYIFNVKRPQEFRRFFFL